MNICFLCLSQYWHCHFGMSLLVIWLINQCTETVVFGNRLSVFFLIFDYVTCHIPFIRNSLANRLCRLYFSRCKYRLTLDQTILFVLLYIFVSSSLILSTLCLKITNFEFLENVSEIKSNKGSNHEICQSLRLNLMIAFIIWYLEFGRVHALRPLLKHQSILMRNQ